MIGKRPINWIYDWLGLGQLGQEYDVLPVVQPVVVLDGIEYPVRYQVFNSTSAIGAGTSGLILINNIISPAQPRKQSILLHCDYSRSNVAAGDSESIIATYNLSETSQPVLVKWINNTANLIAANLNINAVGGVSRHTVPAGSILELRGRQPIWCPRDSSLTFQYSAAAAIGNITVRFAWIDLPADAPLLQLPLL